MQDYRQLKVWQKAHALTLDVYARTRCFRKGEYAALRTQITRAAVSIPANIAEGCGRESKKELARFLQMSVASANELEYHLVLARDLHVLRPDAHARLEPMVTEVSRMLVGLIQSIRGAGAASGCQGKRSY